MKRNTSCTIQKDRSRNSISNDIVLQHFTNPNQRNCRSCVRCRLGRKMCTNARRASWSVCVRARRHLYVRGAARLQRDQCARSTRLAQRAPSQPYASWKLCRATKVLTTRSRASGSVKK